MASWSRRPCRAWTASMTFSRSAGVKGEFRRFFGRQPAPDPVERLLEPVGIHRLQQVVHRVHRERIDRVLVEGGHEHELRQDVRLDQPARDLEAGQAGHLDVEEQQVRLQLARRPQRADAVGRLADDLACRRSGRAGSTAPRARASRRRPPGRGADAWAQAVARSETSISGISMRASVPCPGDAVQTQLTVRAVDDAQPLVDVAQTDAVLGRGRPGGRSACRRRCPRPRSRRGRRDALARMVMRPSPTLRERPCLIEFSTSGWRIMLGTMTSRLAVVDRLRRRRGSGRTGCARCRDTRRWPPVPRAA